MYKAIVEGNRVCNDRAVHSSRVLHKLKLAQTTKAVDNSPPETHKKRLNRSSQAFQFEMRCNEIERHNLLLLSKMDNLKPQLSPTPQPSKTARTRSRLEKQKEQIGHENIKILKKLQQQKSSYNVYTWEVERRKNQDYSKMIRYHKPNSMQKSRTSFRSQNARQSQNTNNRELYDLYQSHLSEEDKAANLALPSIHGAVSHDMFMQIKDHAILKAQRDKQQLEMKKPKVKRPPPLDVGYNEHGMDTERKVLYRNFHEIDGQVYLVEISRNKTKVFVSLFVDYEVPEQFMVQVLSEKLAFSMMRRHNN